MVKTTLHLPAELKMAVAAEAARRQVSEAEVMRDAVAVAAAGFEHSRPRGGFLTGEWEPVNWNGDDWLEAFGAAVDSRECGCG
ncbi:MAG: ribbon-helix-helix domain-containing protein [Bifidobacteriaceae bacterium]|nr:ribbon-helix-helix domain-containing protein [Bifidobacteriaceae bacterium]